MESFQRQLFNIIYNLNFFLGHKVDKLNATPFGLSAISLSAMWTWTEETE